MIGVVTNEGELPTAHEFFQLFKTPWEPYSEAGSYDVVLTTGVAPDGCECKLLVVFCSQPVALDAQTGVPFRRRLRNRLVELEPGRMPVYGDLATTPTPANAIGGIVDDSEALGCFFLRNGRKEVRLGYDLFSEVAFLLARGQPPENAGFPTLDLHIEFLRQLIIEAGLPLVEIPPAPSGMSFISCLTHDIDFVSLRQHRLDRAMCGFFYRATLGTLSDYLRGRCSLRKVRKNAVAALKWPLVQVGLCEDFWMQFGNYLEAEQGRPSTFFLIPFKNRCGKAPAGRDSSRRAVRYDVDDVNDWIPKLRERGCEVAVHGLDAWNDRSAGRDELDRVASRTGERDAGLRMHWLYFAEQSPQEIEAAGFGYDSTCGYNDAVGYRAGTSQVFQPPGTSKLLELPLHMQDTAMFFPGRMHLTEPEAWQLFTRLLEHCQKHGGVLTVLWHDRSLVPERLWDEFYAAVLRELSKAQTWFGTARDVVGWFKTRRAVRFQSVRREDGRLEVSLANVPVNPTRDLSLRVTLAGNRPGEVTRFEVPVKGRAQISFNLPATADRVQVPAAAETSAMRTHSMQTPRQTATAKRE